MFFQVKVFLFSFFKVHAKIGQGGQGRVYRVSKPTIGGVEEELQRIRANSGCGLSLTPNSSSATANDTITINQPSSNPSPAPKEYALKIVKILSAIFIFSAVFLVSIPSKKVITN